jgi:hypothetical protein
LLAELAEVIARAKFVARIREAGLTAAELVEDYARLAEIVVPALLTEPVSRDPDDDLVLATVLGAVGRRQPAALGSVLDQRASARLSCIARKSIAL